MQGCPEHQGKLAWRDFQGPWVPEDSLDLLVHLGQASHLELTIWRAQDCHLFLLSLEHVDQKGRRVYRDFQGSRGTLGALVCQERKEKREKQDWQDWMVGPDWRVSRGHRG